ncbi:hypothetical protein AB0N14_17400 [Streptomyces sp. NPDC051104]|uniref:hypothetical protein n=1 Tax=Streptomyces sp. NPDC051104 TaxID=3155044 RepID=UPI00342AC14D
MPQRTTIASASGLVVGIASTLIVTGDVPGSDSAGQTAIMVAWFFAMVCVTVVASAAMKKWIKSLDERNRNQLDQIARERTAFAEACERRTAELNEREERLNRKAQASGAHMMSLARRLDQALTRNGQLEDQLSEVTHEYADLAREHNALITETLQERSDRFARKTATAPVRPAAPAPRAQAPMANDPTQTYADERGGHHPVEPIPLRRTPSPAAHLVEQPQHERPAKGVGSPR